MQHDLAHAYWRNGAIYKAEQLQINVVESRKNALGEDRPELLGLQTVLGQVYVELGKTLFALLKHVVELRGRLLPAEDLSRLDPEYVLAQYYNKSALYEEAL